MSIESIEQSRTINEYKITVKIMHPNPYCLDKTENKIRKLLDMIQECLDSPDDEDSYPKEAFQE